MDSCNILFATVQNQIIDGRLLPCEPCDPRRCTCCCCCAPPGDDETQAAADQASAMFRRRRQARRAAFGMSKAVRCDGTLWDMWAALGSKDAACTLATLHRLVHSFFLLIGAVYLLRRALPVGMRPLVMTLFTVIVSAVTLSQYGPQGFKGKSFAVQASRSLELIVLVGVYFMPALAQLTTDLNIPILGSAVREINKKIVQQVVEFIARIPVISNAVRNRVPLS